MPFVISYHDGDDALTAAAPTAKEALETAGKLVELGKTSVTVTNADTGEVYGHERIQEALEKGPEGA